MDSNKKFMKINKIPRCYVKTFIESLHEQIFSVTFLKRDSTEIREMNCRQHVVKHLKGGERAYEFEEKGLIPVYDLVKSAYRCIPLEGIMTIRAKGEEYRVY